ncbi:protein containing Primase [gut metagenome]|uniref:Protein containing Primase n=1 Tax=gut metagenome TaxID=749906 RepID=J9GK05_9ZZZZ
MENINLLQDIAKAVRLANANIAPTYEEYYILGLGIASSCGESGRPYFHELCAYSSKYRAADAEKFFTYCLHHANGQVSIGSVVWLAEQAGVTLDRKYHADTKYSIVLNTGHSHTHTQARVSYKGKNEPADEPDDEPDDTEEEIDGPEDSEVTNLPRFPEYQWPPFIRQMLDCAPSRPQRDALLLAIHTALGATLNWNIRTFYGDTYCYPNLLCFVVGHPASGKSVVNWVKQLIMPFQHELLDKYQHELAEYNTARMDWEKQGKTRKGNDMPTPPELKIFLIPGNNSATGIKDNLISAGGVGLIIETEADTMGSAISADYGHWSDTLRKGYDNDEISFYRRQGREYRQCTRSCFSVQLTGTPSQLPNIIPSTEDGLYSRFLFYVLPRISQWKNQFGKNKTNVPALFEKWGREWKAVIDAIRCCASSFDLRLTPAQEERFNAHFEQVFGKAYIIYGSSMESAVARLGTNTCRLMCTLAFVRAIESFLPTPENPLSTTLPGNPRDVLKKLLASPHIQPAEHVSKANVKEGAVSAFKLTISDEDFDAAMGLTFPLYRHAAYILHLLPNEEKTHHRYQNARELFNHLPQRFSREEAMTKGKELHLSRRSIDDLLQRSVKKGILVKIERGLYEFKRPDPTE